MRPSATLMPRRLGAVLTLLAALLVAPGPAAAQDELEAGSGGPPSLPSSEIPPLPDGYALGARRAIRIADGVQIVRDQAVEDGRLIAQPRTADGLGWEIGFFADDEEVAQVTVDGVSGEVREAWNGYQVAWRMARGYEEQFGHKLNAPYVWIPLAMVFFLALFDFRRPWRIAHLDLLVLLSFGISNFVYNNADIDLSVPFAYPPLIYLLCRMLWVGFGRRSLGLRPSAPTAVLATFVLFLVGFRVAVNVVDSGVVDVGYAGVIGADRLTDGEPIWGEGTFPDDNSFGDTYGPANYLAYVPFEAAFPWSGAWDTLPAGHAAAIGFDLLAVIGLFLAGLTLGRRRRGPPEAPESSTERQARRERGTRLGTILAFAWVAYPYSMFALQSNTNDALVGALIALAIAAFASPAGRGVLTGLAAMVKFAPLPLAPLFAVGERGLADRLRPLRGGGWREPIAFSLAFAVVVGGLLAIPAIGEGLGTFYDRAIKSQLDRESPFSIWGQYPALEGVQRGVQLAAVALAVLVAFVPRRRSWPRVAALGAAVLIASQIALDHWFYLYIPWFLSALLIAIAAPGGEPEPSDEKPPADPDPAFEPPPREPEEHRAPERTPAGISAARARRAAPG